MPWTRALRAGLLAVSLLAAMTLLAAPPSTAGANPMVKKINDFRRAHGVPPLRSSPRLSRASKGFARRLMRTNRLGHASSVQGDRRYSSTGEILALQGGWRVRRAAAMRSWRRSPGHRSILLSRRFRRAGAGLSRGHFGGRPSSIWVVRFGRR